VNQKQKTRFLVFPAVLQLQKQWKYVKCLKKNVKITDLCINQEGVLREQDLLGDDSSYDSHNPKEMLY
jgi:hypothetical protein